MAKKISLIVHTGLQVGGYSKVMVSDNFVNPTDYPTESQCKAVCPNNTYTNSWDRYVENNRQFCNCIIPETSGGKRGGK